MLDSLPASTFLALEIAWVTLVVIWIVRERRTPTSTLAWILALVFLPWVGVFVYFFFGPRGTRRRKLAHARARASAKSATSETGRHDLTPVEASELARLAERTGGMPAMSCTDARLYFDGASTYDAMLDAIASAHDHIHFESYIFAVGKTGTRILEALAERAKAGVEVRLLVDHVGSFGIGERTFRPLVKAGGRVARFGATPLSRFRPRFLNFRTHRKILVIDGRVGFTGGINVDDVQDARHAGDAAWRDTHARIEGDAVRGLQATFAQNWRYATDESLRGGRYFPPSNKAGNHIVQIVPGAPDDVYAIHKFFLGAINGAHERLLITTPYFVPDDAIRDALAVAALRGVDVQVLVPESCDNPFVDAAMRTYFDELVPLGVRFHEYQPRMLHAKTFVVDHSLAVVGSANFDNRSLRLNFEVVAAFYGGPLVTELADRFATDLASSRTITRRELDAESEPRRFWEALTRLLAPLL